MYVHLEHSPLSPVQRQEYRTLPGGGNPSFLLRYAYTVHLRHNTVLFPTSQGGLSSPSRVSERVIIYAYGAGGSAQRWLQPPLPSALVMLVLAVAYVAATAVLHWAYATMALWLWFWPSGR